MQDTVISEKVCSLEQQQFLLEAKLSDHHRQIQSLKKLLVSEAKVDASKKNTSQVPHQVSAQKQSSTKAKDKTKKKAHAFYDNVLKPVTSPKKETNALKKIKPQKTRGYHNLEQDFGKTWFVRLGILTLLTGLISLLFTYRGF